jgi:hypothetical protein
VRRVPTRQLEPFKLSLHLSFTIFFGIKYGQSAFCAESDRVRAHR